MLLFVLTLFTGIGIGIIASLVGVGGGFLAVPYLIYVCSLSPIEAVGTSLVMVTGTGYSSTVGYLKKIKPHLPLGISLGFLAVPGLYLGYVLLNILSVVNFKVAFGLTMIIIALYLGSGSRDRIAKGDWNVKSKGKWWYFSPMGFFGGIISGFFGVGGGVIYTPYLILGPRFEPKQAVGTSLLAIAVSGTFAVLLYGYTSNISPSLAILLLIGTIIGSQIGVKLSLRVKTTHIVLALSAIIFLTGVKIFLDPFI